MSSTHILIIDDEPQIRKLLEINLVNQGYKVSHAATGKEGIHLAASHQPDLILLDIGLPDINGHDVLKELKTWFTRPVIILSVENSEEDIVSALDSGAEDYLVKPFRSGELLARIRNAARRFTGTETESIVISGDIKIDLSSHSVYKSDKLLKLTSTEFKLLALLASNHNKVLTHQYILKQIWGPGFQTETQYLRVFIAQIRKKIENNSDDPGHLITESGVGYRFI